MTPTAGAEDKPILSHSMFGWGSEKVLVLHSWIDDASSFDGVKPFLDRQAFTFVFANLHGYGSSRHMAGQYTADEYTKTFLLGSIHHPELAKQLVAGLTGGRLPAAFYRSMTEKNIATSRADAMQGYDEMWVHTDFSAEAKAAQVGTPIRVIGGRQDLPGFQEEKYRATFSAWYPNADLQFITDAGHFPMYETPLYFAALVDEFLKAHSGQ